MGPAWLSRSCQAWLRSTPRAPLPELVSAWACSRPGSPSVVRLGLARFGLTGLSLSLTCPSLGPKINFSTAAPVVKCVGGVHKSALRCAGRKIDGWGGDWGLLSSVRCCPASAQLGTRRLVPGWPDFIQAGLAQLSSAWHTPAQLGRAWSWTCPDLVLSANFSTPHRWFH